MFTKKNILLFFISIFSFSSQILHGVKKSNCSLHKAIKEGNPTKLENSIKKHTKKKDALNKPNKKGESPLHYAIKKQRNLCTFILLRNQADVEAMTLKSKTPLHYAAKYGSQEIIKQLLFYDAELEAEDYNGRTPLHLAAKNGNTSLVAFLLQKKAQTTVRDFTGETPLDLAKTAGHNDIVDLLEND